MQPPSSFLSIVFFVSCLLSPVVKASPGAHGPNGEHLDAPFSSNATSLMRLPDGSVNMPKQAQRRLSIRTRMVHEKEYPLTVELNGRVAIDPNAGGRVQAPFAGRIMPGPNGLPIAGQRVQKGQILLRVNPVSSAVERGNQQALLADIRANRKLTEQRVKRLEQLEGTVPQKEIEAARAELISLIGRGKAVAGSVGGSEVITAPASGVIASANALNGQIVEARDVLFEIVDPQRMLIEAMTTDVTLVDRIASANLATLSDMELKLLGGARSLKDGALPLFFRASGENMPLAVGQPVTVIANLTDKVKGIALPAEALVRNPSNEPIVWIKSGSERFIAQPVEYKMLNAITIIVTKGLAPDNRVVVSGTALVNQIR